MKPITYADRKGLGKSLAHLETVCHNCKCEERIAKEKLERLVKERSELPIRKRTPIGLLRRIEAAKMAAETASYLTEKAHDARNAISALLLQAEAA